MSDSVQTVEETCRQLLYAGAVDASAGGLGLAQQQGEVRGLGWRHVPAEALGGDSRADFLRRARTALPIP